MSTPLRVVDGERDVWLEWRRGGLGASDIAAVAGLSPFETPTGVYLKKIGFLRERDDEDWQRIAHRLEPVIGELYCDERAGWGVIEPQACVTHPEYEWMRATLDAKAIPPREERVADPWLWLPFECKTTTRWNADWRSTDDDEDSPTYGLPDYYQCQAQWQMGVTGAARSIVAALVDIRRFRWWEVPRRQGEIDLLMSLGEAFWRRVRKRQPPPVDGTERTNEALKDAYRDREREYVDLNADDFQRVLEYREARDARLAAEKVERKAESTVLALLEGAEEARWREEPVLRWSHVQQTRDDLAAVSPVIDWWYGGMPKKRTTHRRLWLPKTKETA